MPISTLMTILLVASYGVFQSKIFCIITKTIIKTIKIKVKLLGI